jgi:N-acetylglucosaminyl-diphospho-decaprenol L-rhamnosyltransferase
MIYFLSVNYYSKDFIQELISSLEKSILSPYRLLIVNNSPEEKDIHELNCRHIEIIESGKNLGFGQACNLGIKYVWRQDHNALIWLINPDATIEKDADIYVYKCLKNHPDISILGTGIQSINGNTWFSKGVLNRWTGLIHHSIIEYDDDDAEADILSSDWISGCSLILNLSQFNQCPAFDSSYFLYLEDVDLCWRYSSQGHSIAVTKRILVTHKISSIIGSRTQFMFRHYTFGRLLFLWRHATSIGFFIYVLYLIPKIIFLFCGSRSSRKSALGRILGVFDFSRSIISGKSTLKP